MSCIHGHAPRCGCGDCRIARCDKVIVPEPRGRALIACQIRTGPGMTWTDRTYEVVPGENGQWMIDFGEGALEPRRSWMDVMDWFQSLRPRDVELLEVT